MNVTRGSQIVETFGPFYARDENGQWWRTYGGDDPVAVRGPVINLLLWSAGCIGSSIAMVMLCNGVIQ
jgi:hypothetical protein